MTREQEELLLKDLCGRLPYGVVIQEKCVEHDETFLPNEEVDRLVNIDVCDGTLMTNGGSFYHVDEVKPYLFPLSSMTEEQKREEYKLMNSNFYTATVDLPDFYNKNHIDYRGLIPMGLAIDATGKGIY